MGLSVNVSARQLTDESVGLMVAALLRETGVPANALCLEVTETAVLADPVRVAARLEELRTLGVRIAFDDFGTGYSSLRHLSQLPVDVIKLDRTFVSALDRPEGRRDRAILVAVTTAARELGISVVAEGVEDTKQLAELRRAGCDYGQGFLFSEPRPAGTTAPDAAAVVALPDSGQVARSASTPVVPGALGGGARVHRLRGGALS
jgi:EAL domain-containing protein (putative c-di-GMP-specific phosphodiesterase class I)